MTATMPAAPATRWGQLALGVICMVAIASPQYAWALLTGPLGRRLGTAPAALQVTFSLLIVLQTFFSPMQGWLADRYGPRRLIAAGALLTGLSWGLAAFAMSLPMLWLSYGVVGGFGTGIVYVGVIGQMAAWFPDRRGFATGMAAAGYGMGAILTTFPISVSLDTAGVQATLLRFGLGFAAVGLLAAQGLRPPPAAAGAGTDDAGMPVTALLRHRVFWVMFVMMTLMATSGLMVTSQLGVLAGDFGVARATVWGMAALPLALTIDRVANGLTRPFFGWLSDRIGRERTMALAFSLEAAAMAAWLALHGNPVLFVVLSGVVFFGWGEIFSLFPATLTDTFGHRNATRNYGCLYVAQGIGAILGGPLASLLHTAAGSWTAVFAAAIAGDLLAAALALAVLRPLRRRIGTARAGR